MCLPTDLTSGLTQFNKNILFFYLLLLLFLYNASTPFSYGVLALKKTVEYDIAGNSVIKKMYINLHLLHNMNYCIILMLTSRVSGEHTHTHTLKILTPSSHSEFQMQYSKSFHSFNTYSYIF